MTSRTLAVVAMRTSGLIFLAGTLASTPLTVFSATVAARGTFGGPPALVPNLVGHLLAAVALVVFADHLARWAIPDAGGSAEVALDAVHLGRVALAAVGILLIVMGVENIAAAGYTLTTKPPGPLGLRQVPDRLWNAERERIARAVMAFAAGLALLWRNRIGGALQASPAATRRPPIGE